MSRAEFAYAQARMHARMDNRFSESTWRLLASSRNLGSCIDVVNQTPAARITARMDRTYSVHAVERVLREEWSATVREMASWLPEKWRDATHWMAVLPHLRRFEHASESSSSFRWLRLETEFPEAAGVMGVERKLAPPEPSVAGVWRSEWCLRLPHKRHGAQIDAALSPLLDRYLVNGTPQADEASKAWSHLAEYLSSLFRKHSQAPVAMFAFLGVIALDFERLRGVFADRIIFSKPVEGEGL